MSVNYQSLNDRLALKILVLRFKMLKVRESIVDAQQQHEMIEFEATANSRRLQVATLVKALLSEGRRREAALLASTFGDELPMLETTEDLLVTTACTKQIERVRMLALTNHELLQRQLDILRERLARLMVARTVLQLRCRQ